MIIQNQAPAAKNYLCPLIERSATSFGIFMPNVYSGSPFSRKEVTFHSLLHREQATSACNFNQMIKCKDLNNCISDWYASKCIVRISSARDHYLIAPAAKRFPPPLILVTPYLLILTTLPYNKAGWRNNDVIYV